MSNEAAERARLFGALWDVVPSGSRSFVRLTVTEALAYERKATVERIRAATHADPRPLAASLDAILDAEAERLIIEPVFTSGNGVVPTRRHISLEGTAIRVIGPVVTVDFPDDYDAAKVAVLRLKASLDSLLATYPQPVPEGAGGFVEADRG